MMTLGDSGGSRTGGSPVAPLVIGERGREGNREALISLSIRAFSIPRLTRRLCHVEGERDWSRWVRLADCDATLPPGCLCEPEGIRVESGRLSPRVEGREGTLTGEMPTEVSFRDGTTVCGCDNSSCISWTCFCKACAFASASKSDVLSCLISEWASESSNVCSCVKAEAISSLSDIDWFFGRC